MPKRLISVLAIFGIFIVSVRADVTKIAVLDLDPTGISQKDAQFLSDRLRAELFETGKFQIVERDKMREILVEQGFQKSGCTTLECAVEIGQLLNVEKIVAGSIGKIDDIFSISLRMIDIASGAIEKTATRDYEGKLSEVLTETIPEVAGQLSEEQKEILEPDDAASPDSMRWSLGIKGGLAFLSYTGDLNDAINMFRNQVEYDIENFVGNGFLALEGRYYLNSDWQLKLGISVVGMLSPWTIDFTGKIAKYSGGLERKYRFTSLYFGTNYTILRSNDRYKWYLGLSLGNKILESFLKQNISSPQQNAVNREDTYTYSMFMVDIDLGLEYALSSRFTVGFEIGTQLVGDYDTSGEIETKAGDLPDEYIPFVYPEKIPGAGLKLAVAIFVHI